MRVRRRLLVGSLVVAAVVSVVAGWAIARSNSDASSADDVLVDSGQFDVPTLNTNAAVEGDPFAIVDVQTVDGDDVSTAELVGAPLVVNIWGSTCAPCKQELPDFAAAQAEYGDQVRFVGISYLPPSEREEAFARDRGVQYELLYDTDGNFVDEAGIAAFPVTYFVTPDGTVVEQKGQLDQAEISSLIEDLLL